MKNVSFLSRNFFFFIALLDQKTLWNIYSLWCCRMIVILSLLSKYTKYYLWNRKMTKNNKTMSRNLSTVQYYCMKNESKLQSKIEWIHFNMNMEWMWTFFHRNNNGKKSVFVVNSSAFIVSDAYKTLQYFLHFFFVVLFLLKHTALSGNVENRTFISLFSQCDLFFLSPYIYIQ